MILIIDIAILMLFDEFNGDEIQSSAARLH
jgi:hypothetical protein